MYYLCLDIVAIDRIHQLCHDRFGLVYTFSIIIRGIYYRPTPLVITDIAIYATLMIIPRMRTRFANVGSSCLTTKYPIMPPIHPNRIGKIYHQLLLFSTILLSIVINIHTTPIYKKIFHYQE